MRRAGALQLLAARRVPILRFGLLLVGPDSGGQDDLDAALSVHPQLGHLRRPCRPADVVSYEWALRPGVKHCVNALGLELSQPLCQGSYAQGSSTTLMQPSARREKISYPYTPWLRGSLWHGGKDSMHASRRGDGR